MSTLSTKQTGKGRKAQKDAMSAATCREALNARSARVAFFSFSAR
jgi:hypothetical protein